jgi:hypothetical protein
MIAALGLGLWSVKNDRDRAFAARDRMLGLTKQALAGWNAELFLTKELKYKYQVAETRAVQAELRATSAEKWLAIALTPEVKGYVAKHRTQVCKYDKARKVHKVKEGKTIWQLATTL